MSESMLIIIDVQRGFINEWTEFIPKKAEDLQSRFGQTWVSRFINPEGSLHRSLIGWDRFAPGSFDTELAFTPRPDAVQFEKSNYTCVSDDILAAVTDAGISEVHLCGIATDNCVLKTAVDLFEAGLRPVVLAFACASHGGAESHEAGIKLLKRFIGDGQVIEDEKLFPG